jgi:hypothetical protein
MSNKKCASKDYSTSSPFSRHPLHCVSKVVFTDSNEDGADSQHPEGLPCAVHGRGLHRSVKREWDLLVQGRTGAPVEDLG